MNKWWNLKLSLAAVASLALVTSASATVFGDWPVGSAIYWDNKPVPPWSPGLNIGTNYVGSDGNLWMPVPSAGQKLTSWPPYPSYAGEKMSLAKLVLNPGAAVTSVHAGIYDLWTANKHGWAVILEDSAGKMLDFGVRIVGPSVTGQAKIVPKEWNGSSWVYPLGTSYYGREAVNPKYFYMDFLQNPSGTITWTISVAQGASPYTNSFTSATAFGNLTGIYLSTMTDSSPTVQTYKWTEFWANPIPEPTAALTLGAGCLALAYFARRKRI